MELTESELEYGRKKHIRMRPLDPPSSEGDKIRALIGIHVDNVDLYNETFTVSIWGISKACSGKECTEIDVQHLLEKLNDEHK